MALTFFGVFFRALLFCPRGFRGAGAVFRVGVFGGDGERRAQTTLQLAIGGDNGARSQVRGGQAIDVGSLFFCVDFSPALTCQTNRDVLSCNISGFFWVRVESVPCSQLRTC